MNVSLNTLVNIFQKCAQPLPLGTSTGDSIQEAKKIAASFENILSHDHDRPGWTDYYPARNVVAAILSEEPLNKKDKEWSVIDVSSNYPLIPIDLWKKMLKFYSYAGTTS